ncbi:MAG: M20/M25/M40 family metallo-hydrolase, partial [Pseudomonadota bacterium]
IPSLVAVLDRLAREPLDHCTDHFDASTLAITTVDVGNPANNVIPAQARATVNIRFNDAHTSDSVARWLQERIDAVVADTDVEIRMNIKVSGESFVTPPGTFTDLVADAVAAETGRVPERSTSGGTSDARFVRAHCPVVEVGLVGQSMHQVDEHVAVAHIEQLKAIYTRILRAYFA